jgi:lipoprotein signal peptidase
MNAKAERSFRGLLWGLALVGLTLDQATKYGVFKWLYNGTDHGEYEVVPGKFQLLAQFTPERETGSSLWSALRTWSSDALPKVNHGALFGLGGQYVTYANLVFAVVSILAAAAIIYWSTRQATVRDGVLCAALGLILAGTLGNFYDRIVFNGVRDFLHFYWVEWPVFNVADCCLVCGAGLLLLQAFRTQPAAEEPPAVGALTAEVLQVE